MKSKISVHDRATLASEIAALAEATLADLKSRWRVLYGTEPPPRISRDLLTRAVAYRIQEKTLGGLRPSTRRLLAKVAADSSARRPIQVTLAPILTPDLVDAVTQQFNTTTSMGTTTSTSLSPISASSRCSAGRSMVPPRHATIVVRGL